MYTLYQYFYKSGLTSVLQRSSTLTRVRPILFIFPIQKLCIEGKVAFLFLSIGWYHCRRTIGLRLNMKLNSTNDFNWLVEL